MTDFIRNAFLAAKAIQEDALPPAEGLLASRQLVVPMSLVRNTRGYIERVANQINGSYENGWYDGAAVLLRRLLETLIIEAFEHHKIADRIKNSNGDFLFLRDLIDRCLKEHTWNLSRNCKQSFPRLKDIGDKSAHSRRFNAQRGDLDPYLSDIRLVIEELLYLAALR